MPVVGTITWGSSNPFRDPAFQNIEWLVRYIREHNGASPPGYDGGKVFENRENHLPGAHFGYYREYDVLPKTDARRGPHRMIIGHSGDVWITPDHYTHNWVRIMKMPGAI